MLADFLVAEPFLFDQLHGAAMLGIAAVLWELFKEFLSNQTAEIVERSRADWTGFEFGSA